MSDPIALGFADMRVADGAVGNVRFLQRQHPTDNAVDRREMLRSIIGGAAVVTAAVATVGFALCPGEIEANVQDEIEATLPDAQTSLAAQGNGSDAFAQVTAVPPIGVVPPRRRRRRRRWVCWWYRGRRVCGWRWRWVWV